MSTAGISLVGVYVSPVAKPLDLVCTLSRIKAFCTGKVCVIEDWNSRHITWDRVSNRRGTASIAGKQMSDGRYMPQLRINFSHMSEKQN